MKSKKNNIKDVLSKIFKGEIGLLIILIILGIVFSISSPYFLSSKNLLNITRQTSIVLIISIGMLSVVLIGEIDLSVGSIAALSGVGCAWVILETGSTTLGILAAILIGGLSGSLNGAFTVFGKIPSFIVTLASMGIIRGIALVWTMGKPISGLPEQFSFWGAKYIANIPVSTIISLIIVLISYFIIHKTKHGVYIKSIGANEEAATLSAIPIKRYKMVSFIAVGVLSSIGGILITSKLLSAQPIAAEGIEMDVLSAVILGGASLSGGIGTVSGTLIGALIIAVINNGMNLMGISPFFQQIVKGIIILAAVLMKRKDENND